MSSTELTEDIVGNLFRLDDDVDKRAYDLSLYSRIFQEDTQELDNIWVDVAEGAHILVIKCRPVGRISGFLLYEFHFLCKEKLFGCLLTAEEFGSYFKSN